MRKLPPYLSRIWHATVGQWYMLTGLIPSGSVYIVSLMRDKKPLKYCNFDQNFTFWGDSCAHPPLPIRSNVARDSRPTVYTYTTYTPNFVWIRLLCHLPGTKN